MALIVGGTTVTGTQTLEASTLTGTASAINGSNITSLPAPSTANVASATAGISADAVGAYTFARSTAETERNPNNTLAGSSLRYSNGNGNEGGTLSGTWRCMGYSIANANSASRSTQWLRIS